MYYGRDIDTIQKIYQRHRNDPPVAWDLPPIAGKIAWARQMYRRIQEPMEMFQKYPAILQTVDAKKIIKNYNKLAKVLLEFEVLYHQAWMKQVHVYNTDCSYNEPTAEEFDSKKLLFLPRTTTLSRYPASIHSHVLLKHLTWLPPDLSCS